MRGCLMAIAGLALLAGCASDWDATRADRLSVLGAPASLAFSRPAAATRALDGVASLPDHGEFVVRDTNRKVRVSGAYTAYPIRLSEAHALNAAHAGGKLIVNTPDGQAIELDYERRVEHPDGNWTWIGRDSNQADAVITFGDQAVFGMLPRERGEPLRLTIVAGHAWMVAASSAAQSDRNRAVTRAGGSDYLVPPAASDNAPDTPSNKSTTATYPSDASITFYGAHSTIDLVVGYTFGFAAGLGGHSQAVTRIHNLVDTANQAYSNSEIDATLRLAGAMPVDYPDATDNKDALEKLSGRSGQGAVTPDRAFDKLRAARESYDADLVSLVRHFRAPQNDGCGIAWMIGAGRTEIVPEDAAYGYSVVSDGADLDESDGATYFCREETLVHELGHNMGQTHGFEDSAAPGVDTYAYGYREAIPEGFYTVMAYQLPDGYQVAIPHFANPHVEYEGRPTGIFDKSDNARSMNRVLPAVAAFREAE